MSNFEKEIKAFKLKDKIITSISSEIESEYPEYDFFDITLTQEFMMIEHLISDLVEQTSSSSLVKGHYKHNCEHCD